jgi:ubiquitin-activating enzyme E1
MLDWFEAKGLEAYSISFGAALLYNNIFPKHQERLGTKLSALVKTVAKVDLPQWRNHFDVVVACEDDEGNDIDVPLVSVCYK